ncbi:MAG: phosphoribosylanthranilate isomerase [Acaryochloridaceae cyanobacterium RU_4_10]|nr:phosphoribosylanthranilate isomerase [Acaryochloridaceae cyanobacterium RU_4_10]
MSLSLRIKICGLTRVDQAQAIAALGIDALGFICVPESPRYIAPNAIGKIVAELPAILLSGVALAKIGVFANASLEQIIATVDRGRLTGVQLHGQESPDFCRAIRTALPDVELIKAFRVRDVGSLIETKAYTSSVDTFLLDAFNPHALGGTGETWNWSLVAGFKPDCPWFLAGGLTPMNAIAAVQQVNSTGIDVSSGVERSPGDKDLGLVRALCNALQRQGASSNT